MKPFIFLVLCVLLVASCASRPRDPLVWYQPGKTRAEIQRDWADSLLAQRRAELRIPQPLILNDTGFAAGMAWRARSDARDAAKDIAPLTMQSRGYELVRQSTVPVGEACLPLK